MKREAILHQRRFRALLFDPSASCPLVDPASRRAPAALLRAGMRSAARDEEGARVLISALLRLLELSRCASPQGGAVCNRPEALEKRLSLGLGLQAKARAGRTVRFRGAVDFDLAVGFTVCLAGAAGSCFFVSFCASCCSRAQAQKRARSLPKSAATSARAARTSWRMGSVMMPG